MKVEKQGKVYQQIDATSTHHWQVFVSYHVHITQHYYITSVFAFKDTLKC